MPFSFDGFPTLNETDLMYGLGLERGKYWETGPFRTLKGRNTIDAYSITNDELLSVGDPEIIPYKNREFIQYIARHEKYNSIQSVGSMKIDDEWYYENQSLVIGRKCKAGLGWASENDIHVNFILDKVDMNEVAGTAKTLPSKSITSKELRYLYRNRNNEKISSNVQFWNEGKPVAPPWETDSGAWSHYKPKSEIARLQATAETATEFRPTASATEALTVEELGLEVLI